jgi:hypothetical protein
MPLMKKRRCCKVVPSLSCEATRVADSFDMLSLQAEASHQGDRHGHDQ